MEQLTKPKIIVSSYDDTQNPYYGGGGAIAIHEVFKRLTDNFEITIITGKYPKSKNTLVEKIFYIRVGTDIFGPKIGQIIFQLILPFYVITQGFDIWVENFTPPFSTSCLQIFTKKPVVALVHMLSGEDMWRKYKIPFFLLEHWGLKSYKYFIVLSKSSQKNIRKFNKKAIFFIAPNGISLPSQLKDYSKREKKYMVFIGRIEVNQKGLDLLIKSFSQVKEQLPVKLKIAGDGQTKELKKLQLLISSYNLQNKIELLGKVGGQRKDNLLKQSLLAIIPSRFETFSLSSLEIMSYGIPLIVFDIEGLRWISKECVLKIPTFKTDKLSQAIYKLYQDTKLRQKLSERSLKLARKYSWENTSLIYKNCFERIMQ